uniref:Uncharacterized protein n=1 Tax=Vespula pensylvanica TaxID=30213 RepID=A0A834P383_VESPE|nr:hypothetical protein H0235_008082 [Vespula pensylvanica]
MFEKRKEDEEVKGGKRRRTKEEEEEEEACGVAFHGPCLPRKTSGRSRHHKGNVTQPILLDLSPSRLVLTP